MSADSFFSRDRKRRRGSDRQKISKRSRALRSLESLEDRTLLTSTLFLDYGDLFPTGVLNGITVGDVNSHTAVGGVNINGPTFSDNTGANFAGGTAVELTAFNNLYGGSAASMRSDISTMVRRMLEPYDIDVIELTSTPVSVEGTNVAAATSLDDISLTMAANNGVAKHNDAYMYIVQALIGGTTDDNTTNPTRFASNGYGGLANGLDIGSFNNNENSAFTLLRGTDYSTTFLASQIVHEAGHLFGFQHVYRQDTGSPPPAVLGSRGPDLDIYHGSESMSYLAYTGLDVYSRLPMMDGDGNTDPDILNTAPTATATPYNQLAVDAQVGANGAFSYVTGSGAHDIITITNAGGGLATVLVQPFADAAYTSPIILPGGAATSYTYAISTLNTILVDSGAGNDLIVIDGNISATFTVRAASGVDSITADVHGGYANHVPGSHTENGIDGNPDYRGTIYANLATINYQELESNSDIDFLNINPNFVYWGSPGADDIVVSSPEPGVVRIGGLLNGVPQLPAVDYVGLTTLRFNLGDGDDSLTVDVGATDLISIPITYDGGAGSDLLRLEGTPATAVDETIYRPGPLDDQGSIAYESAANAELMSVHFLGLEPVIDLIPALTLTVFGTGASNAITYNQSSILPAWGQVSVDSFESIHFANKTNLVINALGGSDAISLGNPTTPVGLTTITVNGGLPTDGDHLNYVSRASGAVVLDLSLGTITEVPAPPVTYTGIESISLKGIGAAPSLSVTGTAGQEDFVVSGPITGSGSVTTVLTTPTVAFEDFVGGLAFDGNGGFDSVSLIGNNNANTVTSALNVVTIDTRVVTLTNIDRLNVATNGGDDSITLPLTIAGLVVSVDAGGGNDSINLTGATIASTLHGGAGNDNITGGDGNDTLSGGEGNDVLNGGAGNDNIDGGAGDDQITGGTGDDQLFGGADSDTFRWDAGDGNDLVEGGTGLDVLTFDGVDGAANIFGLIANGDRIDVSLGGISRIDGADVETVNLSDGNTADDTFNVGDLTGTDVQLVNLTYSVTFGNNATISGSPLADTVVLNSVGGPVGTTTVTGLAATVVIHNTGVSSPVLFDRVTVQGLGGNDNLKAQPGAEAVIGITLDGGDGNDTLSADATLLGGAGNDLFYPVNGTNVIDGGAGFDEIVVNGTGGNDTISVSQALAVVTINVNANSSTNTVSNVENIDVNGLAGDDGITLSGLLIPATVDAGAGNDTVNASTVAAVDLVLVGGYGHDAITGGAGNDTLAGGEGDDVLIGGAGNDHIDGGDGNDQITGGTGDDSLFGDADSDTFNWAAGDGTDLVEGGTGLDVLNFDGVDGVANTFDLTANGARIDVELGGITRIDGADVETVNLSDGNTVGDTFNVGDLTGTDVRLVNLTYSTSFDNNASLSGTPLADTVVLNSVGGPVGTTTVNGLAATVVIHNTGVSSPVLFDRVTVQGLGGNDNLKAEPGAEAVIGITLDGGIGDDTLSADATLLGGAGNDLFYPVNGTNVIDGGAGFDEIIVDGTGGNDTISVTEAAGVVITIAVNADTSTNTVSNVEHIAVNGLAGNDTITLSGLTIPATVDAGSGNDFVDASGVTAVDLILLGGDGNDNILGGAGNDTIDGGAGNDVLNGGDGHDDITGGDGNDNIAGGAGNDTIFGGDGNDTIGGGTGGDSLLGGSGSDLFVWNNGDGSDLVEGGEGDDVQVVNGDPVNGNDFDVAAAGVRVLFQRTNLGTFSLDIGTVETLGIVGSTSTDNLTVGNLSDTDLRLIVADLGVDAVRDTVTVAGTNLGDDIGINSSAPGIVSVEQSQNVDVVLRNTSANCPLLPDDDTLTINAGVGNDTIQAAQGVEEEIGLFINGEEGDDFVRANGVIFGGAGNDTLQGAGGLCPVFIDGGDGHDSICGNDGNDTLIGGAGSDTIYGNGGDDSIVGNDGRDWLVGNDGNDTITGDAGNDTILGGAGDDSLTGNDGHDVLLGDADAECTIDEVFLIDVGQGNDTLDGGNGNDVLNGDEGNDSLLGGDGDDLLGPVTFAGVDFGDAGNDTMLGGNGDDTINGDAGDDVINGNDGDDLISGGTGDDSIQGATGDDTIAGDEGDDVIDGGFGDDLISGGEGDDTIHGGFGDDTINGDAGDDDINGGDGDDLIHGGLGDDLINGDAGNDTINGNAGNDLINGGDGDDLIHGGDGEDLISGGNGDDDLYGDAGDDLIFGDAGHDLIAGGAGNDELYGNAGNDTILGGDGHDLIDGGDGNDLIAGGAGNDTIAGGDGNDTVYGQAGDDSVNGNAGDDLIFGERGNDSLCGNDGNDVIDGGDGNDVLNGGDGDDRLLGQAGNDQVWGSAGNDSIYGGDGSDSLVGGDGNDFIDGGNGNDFIWGQAGNDTLWGGNGDDLMYGNAGNDVMLGGTPATANEVHKPRDPRLPSDGNDTMLGGDGFDHVDGGNGNNMLDAGDDGIRETILGGLGNDFGYVHTGTSGHVTGDVAALDGGFNHIFKVGGLLETPVPAEACVYTNFVIPNAAYYGWKLRHDGVLVQHPNKRPSNVVVRITRNVVVDDTPARPTRKAAAKASPFAARAALLKSLRG